MEGQLAQTKTTHSSFPRLSFIEVAKVAFLTAFALIYQSTFSFPLGYQMAWNWLMNGKLLAGASALVVIATPSLASIGMIYLLIGSRKKV